ncbi:MarR family winged helix-turn-helix transcriptional regulator [Chachezhania antarctica]|uniref:MarR family winged helix-turn-helix transcriptional regulator n=1 Tax=Chachezhania antarctica TaxID=2340860 RepID=UPI000EB3DB42|nr:MarR family transcriptional regulator [Chachezhania antarctica]|tara:strand:- start:591 stop:1130 length:540 start_codon:yes stop_codon:yes gene_type:complete
MTAPGRKPVARATLDPAPDATLRRFSGYLIKRAESVVRSDVNAALAPLGLRMFSFSALAVIVDTPGLRQAHLADALAVERPNIVAVLDDLQSRGLVSRERAPDDKRAYALEATTAGHELYRMALAAVTEHEERITKGLSEKDRQALIRALSVLVETGLAETGPRARGEEDEDEDEDEDD